MYLKQFSGPGSFSDAWVCNTDNAIVSPHVASGHTWTTESISQPEWLPCVSYLKEAESAQMQCSPWPADAVTLGNQAASAGSASLELRMALCSAEHGELQRRLYLAQKTVSARQRSSYPSDF